MFRYFLLGLILSSGILSHGQIFINEFMAANSATIEDPEFTDYSDWVELYNAGAMDADLSGYYLTDNLSDTTKWMIPAGTVIPANGYLIFWADGNNSGVHTSYGFSSAGEEIGLYDTALNLIDGLNYAAQQTNISYGRQQDGSTTWSWFSESTPGTSNNLSTAYQGITYYQPFFSQKGGFFDTQLAVELTALGGSIRYTLDGRAPTINDPIYTEPIVFDTSSFIRARVFEDGKIPGPVITHSYFFDPSFAERKLPVVSLVTDPDYFWDPTIGIYVQDFKPEWEQPLNIEFFENDGKNQAVFNTPAGVKINGLWSWQLPQKMLGIYMRTQYGSNALDYPIFPDRDRSSFDEFMLRASGSDWSFTLFRDGLCQSLIQDNALVQSQGFRTSIVFINGEYMGVHNIRSRSNGEDLEALYGLEPDSYDIINNDGEIEEGDDVQYQFLDSLLNTDLSIDANYQLVNEVLDLTNFTDYWITEIWASNSSWGHNVKLWKPKAGGKWQFLYGDLDRGFVGSTDNPISDFSVPVGGGDGYDYGRQWLQHLFANPLYAAYFAQRFTDHLYTALHPVRVNEKIDPFEARLVPEIAYHVERWAGTTSNYGDGIPNVEFWENEVLALRQFAETRQGFMLSDIQSNFDMSDIVTLGTSSLPNGGGSIRINEFKIPHSSWSGSYFADLGFELTAEPKPGYQFEGWSQNELVSLFDLGETWRYLDNGSAPDPNWHGLTFDDNTWTTGAAEFGYGDGDETTNVGYGPDNNNKYITTYFRKEFPYNGDDSQPVSCVLNLRRDDGAVVYLNGEEIARSNMPDGAVDYLTTASSSMGGAAESALNEFLLELPLVTGINVIAVEIHQIDGQSSDISFDASLAAIMASDAIISTELTLPLTLTGDAGYVARYVPTGQCILPAEITENTTLTIDCSPYIASGDTYVLPSVSLAVDPGVEIWFPEEARLIVLGDLQVNGTSAQPVIFKANTIYGAESWGNISFEHSTAVNHLNYLELREATTGYHPIHNRAAISGWFSEIEMDHVTLTDVYDNPIFGEYSSFVLSNSIIQSDVTGDLINVKYGQGYISDCVFLGNDQPDTDAIDYDDVVDGIVRNCVISDFFGFNSDAVDLGEECENILVENCLIHDCTDKGISIGQSSTAVVRNNTIVNCNLGLGIKDLGEAEVEHITLYSNVYGIECYEKNPGLGGGFANVSNSIFSNSSASPAYYDNLSVFNVLNCYYDTDTLPGTTSYWMDPLFENPTNYDFHLQNESQGIDAGLDGEDMGTLDHSFTSGPEIMISDIQYFHLLNPDMEFIRIYNSGDVSVDLSNYQISDAIEFVFPEGVTIAPDEKITLVRDMALFPNQGGQVFQWTSGQLDNDGEMILLIDEHGIIVDHVKYDDLAPWPSITQEDEYLILISPTLDNHFASSWMLSTFIQTEELADSHATTVYPNPSDGLVTLISTHPMHEIAIYNDAGQLVWKKQHNASVATLEMESLPNGLYTIAVDQREYRRVVLFR